MWRVVCFWAQLTSTDSEPSGNGATGRFRLEAGELEGEELTVSQDILAEKIFQKREKCTEISYVGVHVGVCS